MSETLTSGVARTQNLSARLLLDARPVDATPPSAPRSDHLVSDQEYALFRSALTELAAIGIVLQQPDITNESKLRLIASAARRGLNP